MKIRKVFLTFIMVILTVIVFIGCASMQLVSIEQDTVTGPAQVRQGTDINPREITVWGHYKDGSRKVVSVSRSNITFDRNTPGQQLVRVRISGQEATFWTEVMALRSISVASPPRVTLFKQGTNPDPAWPGLEIRGEWDRMGSHIIPIDQCQITGYMRDQAGRQTIRVTYQGLTTTFNIDVRAMTSLEITNLPAKRDYIQGEPLDITGLRVQGLWGDGIPPEDLPITMENITGYNPNNVGVQPIRVTAGGRSATFNIEVYGLTSLELERMPNKVNYVVGEELDLTGIILYGNYTSSDPTKRRRELIPLEQIAVSGFEPNRVENQQRVTLTVRGISVNIFVNIAAESSGGRRPRD